jgi:hypothetical protein
LPIDVWGDGGVIDSGSGRDNPLNPLFGITGGMRVWGGGVIVSWCHMIMAFVDQRFNGYHDQRVRVSWCQRVRVWGVDRTFI